MSFALNEVAAMGKKAARGAGYSWGMAEEAGTAARWLCANDIDGVAALAAVLAVAEGLDLRRRAPVALEGVWHGESGALCPLMTGAALSDAATLWAKTGKRTGTIAVPVLLFPFAALAARRLGGPVCVEWAGVRAVTDGHALDLSSRADAVMAATSEGVVVSAGGTVADIRSARTRAAPRDEDWAVLTRLAHRTYAPDTEQSRQRGAGAGPSDND